MVPVFKELENITLLTTTPKIGEQFYRSGDHAYATEFQVTHLCLEPLRQTLLNRKFCRSPESQNITQFAYLGETA